MTNKDEIIFGVWGNLWSTYSYNGRKLKHHSDVPSDLWHFKSQATQQLVQHFVENKNKGNIKAQIWNKLNSTVLDHQQVQCSFPQLLRVLMDCYYNCKQDGVIQNGQQNFINLVTLQSYPDNKVHGAKMGPTWVLSAPDGPHVGPMNLTIRVVPVHLSCKEPLDSPCLWQFPGQMHCLYPPATMDGWQGLQLQGSIRAGQPLKGRLGPLHVQHIPI